MASAGTAYVDVEAKLDSFASDVEAAVASIETQQVDVSANVEGQDQVDGLTESVGGLADTAGDGVGALDTFGASAFGMGSVSSIAATGGVAALAAGLGFAASEAMDAEATLAQLDQMVVNMGSNAGVTSPALQALATDIQASAGFSDEAVMSGESMVLMFENVRNAAGAPIFDRTIQSAADLARSPFGNGDIASSAKTLGRALNDPAASFGRLARQGITFTEAQQATITAMQESGDMAGAQAAMLDVLDSKVGGLAESYGGTLAGQVDRAKESIGEAAESIGATMIPALADLAIFLGGAAKGFRDLDEDLKGALTSGPIQAILGDGDGMQQVEGSVIGRLPDALARASAATDDFAAAQDAANQAVADTLPTLDGILSKTQTAGEAFGVMNAQSDPQAVIANFQAALDAWDAFQTNIDTIDDWGPRIGAALRELGPEVSGGLTEALANGNIATITQLDGLLAQVEAKGGDISAVLTGFAQDGMTGATNAVASAAGPMGAAGTTAGAAGAAGIDAGLAFTNASNIGQIAGVQYGSGVASGISAMAGTVSAVANNLINGAGSTASAFARGQSVGSSYGAGLVAGLAGQVGNAASTAASLRRAAGTESAAVSTTNVTNTSARSSTYNVTVAGGSPGGDDIARAISDELRKLERAGR